MVDNQTELILESINETDAKEKLTKSTKKSMVKMTEKVSENINYRFALDDVRAADKEKQLRESLEKKQGHMVDDYEHREVNGVRKRSVQSQEDGESSDLVKKVEEIYGSQTPADKKETKELATQTNYTAEDVQRLFIAKIETLMGMRPYRPVSRRGVPRLTAVAQNEQIARLANEKQEYQLHWNQSTSIVKNVPNIDKMRKFEPLRRSESHRRSKS